MIGFILSSIFILIAGMLNGVMDTITDSAHYNKSIFPQTNSPNKWSSRDFYNKDESWYRKWKDGKKNSGEKFLFSTTMFVFTTDFWHLTKFMMLKFIVLSIISFQAFPISDIVVVNLILSFVILSSLFSIGFTIMYDKLLIRKK